MLCWLEPRSRVSGRRWRGQRFHKGSEVVHHCCRGRRPRYNLDLLYLRGDGVVKDLNKALQLFTTAAEAGDPKANHKLGLLYLCGDGVVKDFEQGIAVVHFCCKFRRARVCGVVEAHDAFACGHASGHLGTAELLKQSWRPACPTA